VRPPAATWVPPLVLGVAGVGCALVLPGPAGSDPDLWQWAALNLLAGQASIVPPLFPALIGIGHLGGLAAFDAARVAAAAGAPFLGPLTWALARELGATLRGAWYAGLLPLLTGATAALHGQVMPDLCAATVFTLVALTALRFLAAPGDRRLVALALATALAVVAREHGLAVAGAAGLAAAAAPGPLGARLTRVGTLAGVVLAVGPVLGGTLALPWAQPWFDRLGAMGAPQDVARAIPDPGWLDRPAWALELVPEGFVWVTLGLAACLVRDRRLILVPILLPAFAALATWSQPRHVAVLLPVAFAAWAAREGSGWRWLGLLAAGFGLARVPFHVDRLRVEHARIEELRRFGEALCAKAAPSDLAWGEPSAFLFCPLRWHEIDGTPTDWKVWAVGVVPERPGWSEVYLGVGGFSVRRLDPSRAGRDRPCADSAPLPTSSWFTSPPATARLDPPCTESPTDGGVRRTRVRPRGSAGR